MLCYDCPRMCGADRDKSIGFCGVGEKARVAKTIAPFEYEEPCLGELTAVFFSGCNMRCSYCQNYAISRAAAGKEYTDKELAALFDGAVGALDLVTPTHFLRAVCRAIPLCESKHRVIWNTSGYETVKSVERASEVVDVFLTDFKYCDGRIAARYSSAPDYFERAKAAVKLMREKIDKVENIDGKPTLVGGLIVRHLVLPGCVEDSKRVLDFIASELGTDTCISLMSQFTPNGVGAPDAKLKKIEYKIVVEHALKLGFKNGFIQDFGSADSRFIPDFSVNE